MGYLAAAGAVLNMFGQYKSSQQAAKVYDYNQSLAQYQAQYFQKEGAISTAQLKSETSKTIGRQRAIQGASGLTSNSTSNLATIAETERQSALDAAIIRYRADISSYGALNNANLMGWQSDEAKKAGFLGVGSTLLTEASKYDYSKMFGGTTSSSSKIPYIPAK